MNSSFRIAEADPFGTFLILWLVLRTTVLGKDGLFSSAPDSCLITSSHVDQRCTMIEYCWRLVKEMRGTDHVGYRQVEREP